MARLDIAIEHRQPMDLAQAKFETAIREAEAKFGSWVGRVDWSDDRRSATVSGSNYNVKVWYDERDVHAQGTIPMAWKLLEGVVRGQMKKIIDRST